jgi:hypothetical protein
VFMYRWKQGASREEQGLLDDAASDRFGRAIAMRLSDGTRDLSPVVAERLQMARSRAIAKRKLAPQRSRPLFARALSAFEDSPRWLRIGAIVPLVALVAGLILIKVVVEQRAAQLEDRQAQVDAQLLTDALPLAAYLDVGFREFLTSNQRREAIREDASKEDPVPIDAQHV